jgi:hypothetical protein
MTRGMPSINGEKISMTTILTSDVYLSPPLIGNILFTSRILSDWLETIITDHLF